MSTQAAAKKLKTLHDNFCKSLDKVELPTAESVLKSLVDKCSTYSSTLLQEDVVASLNDLIRQAFSQAMGQAKEEALDILRERKVEEVLARLAELAELSEHSVSLLEQPEFVEERRKVVLAEISRQQAALDEEEKEVQNLKDQLGRAQQKRSDVIAKANDLIEKIGQQMISDEFQSAIDFAEPMTETGFLPDQIRKRK